MSESLLLQRFQSIMEPILSELEDACNEPLTPDPLNRPQEANIMLPEIERPDYSISTPPTEDKFECDRCQSTEYVYVLSPGVVVGSHAECLECGTLRPTTPDFSCIWGAL